MLSPFYDSVRAVIMKLCFPVVDPVRLGFLETAKRCRDKVEDGELAREDMKYVDTLRRRHCLCS